MNILDWDYLKLDVKFAQLERSQKQLTTMVDETRFYAGKPVDMSYLIDEEREDDIEMQKHFEPSVYECIRDGMPF